jgi:hypothetical protein
VVVEVVEELGGRPYVKVYGIRTKADGPLSAMGTVPEWVSAHARKGSQGLDLPMQMEISLAKDCSSPG